jgi:hypothetical protein
MKNTEESAWERSFQIGPRLTPEEVHRVVVLRSRLTGLRYLSSEYLLRRAAHSGTKSERTAWQSVWALSVFVEHAKRFPRQGELYPYLHGILDESKILEDLNLPPMDVLPMGDASEAQKSLLEDLVATNLLLSKKVSLLAATLDNALNAIEHSVKVARDGEVLRKESSDNFERFAREGQAIRRANSLS